MSEHFILSFDLTTSQVGSLANTHCLYLYDFLKLRLTQSDQLELSNLFAQGCITVNNAAVTAACTLNGDERISVALPGHTEDEVDTRWQLLWQNSELMAVYKPHHLPVSRTTRNLYNTLISLVRRQTPYRDARLLHRLDTETSGVMLLAKDAEADRRWKPRLNELISQKIYHAVVSGIPGWQFKTMKCYLSERSDSDIRSQVYVVDPAEEAALIKPRFSMTEFRLLYADADRALVECQLLTGRKHQIRAQLSYLGHPLIGDRIYSYQGRFYLKRIEQGLDPTDFSVLGSTYHLLQAVELVLNIDGEMLRVAVPQSLRLIADKGVSLQG